MNRLDKNKEVDFTDELIHVLNSHCIDSMCNTPDFILADYLMECIYNYSNIKERLYKWENT